MTFQPQNRQKMIEPPPQVKYIKKLVKFGRVFYEICERRDKQTDRQTDRHADTLNTILHTPIGTT